LFYTRRLKENENAGYGEVYGGLKFLCERAAKEAMPNRVLNVRAGMESEREMELMNILLN